MNAQPAQSGMSAPVGQTPADTGAGATAAPPGDANPTPANPPTQPAEPQSSMQGPASTPPGSTAPN
jgi:hypothetical protein